MALRVGLLALATLFSVCFLVPNQARADLLGTGKTVQAFYYNGVFVGPEGEIAVGASTTDPHTLLTPVNYQQGAADGSTIAIDATQIIIKNLLTNAPFCVLNTPGTSCTDVIDGFDFLFTGENITGVSVDPASAADFQPVTGTFHGNTHLGLQLISANEVRVDVTGDVPAVNDQLVIDLSFPGTTNTVPEPDTLSIVGAALGLCIVARRTGWVSKRFQ